ncbi:YhdP family protein [Legionella israelensis]|nr:YhdP family protein [Legionella israelensis]
MMSIGQSNGIVRALKHHRSLPVNKIIKRSWLILASAIIILAVFSSIFRALTPWASQYKSQIEQRLSTVIGRPVKIGQMETGWYWFEPVIKLKQVVVNGGKNESPRLDKLFVGINLFSSLWHWQIQPGVLYVEDAHFALYEDKGKWRIEGLSASELNAHPFTPEVIQHYISLLALQQRLVIKQVSLSLHFSDGTLIPIDDFNLKIVNHSGHYKAEGQARLEQTSESHFKLLADLYFNPNHIHRTKGEIFVSLKNILPAQLQDIFPKAAQRFEAGKGNINIWMSIARGQVATIQSQLHFRHLAWQLKNQNKQQLIQSIKGNIAWKAKDSGWQLSADHLQLRYAGVRWPENQFQLIYDNQNQSYQFYIKSLIIESLLPEITHWRPSLHFLSKIQTHGELHDTQIHFANHQVNYFLSHFEKLGWHAHGSVPGSNHLSGVIHWQPDSGHLALDSENALIAFQGYPGQIFSILNGEFDWKNLSHGLRLSIARFVLNRPDLTLSMQGVLDDLSSDSLGYTHLVTDFSAKNIEKWLHYLPEQHLKPKLASWLKKDIKRIAQGSGRVIFHGKPSDFPFDDQSGVFKIQSHLSGAELRFNSKWPFVHDIDAYLRVNKRLLEADIINADIQGMPVKEINLNVDDIGHDKEMLLIHGKTEGSAQKMIDFVMNSPLQKRLSMMKMLKIYGLLNLDLKLQIPLYPENDKILARGNIHFLDNSVSFYHSLGKLKLNNLSGQLDFDEEGVTKSTFKGKALGYPFKMSIRSTKTPKPYTSVMIENHITAKELRKQYQLPILNFLQGRISATTHLKLTDDPNDLDHLHMRSSLKGLAIDLPSPLGKTSDKNAPLMVDVDFNPKKAMRLRLNYDARLSTDMWFEEKNGRLSLYSGEMRLGSGHALKQSQQGVRVLGSVPVLDLEQWSKVLSSVSEKNTDLTIFPYLNFIDLHVGKAVLFDNTFSQLYFKASKLNAKDWSIFIKQPKIMADLRFQPRDYLLSGYFKRLQLASPGLKTSSASQLNLHPSQIPHLNLRIDNFLLDDLNLGNITIKSHSTEKKWLLDYGKITAPGYQLNVTGEWEKNSSKSQTSVNGKLLISDLARSLEHFKIDPVVEADHGEVDFNGTWPGSMLDFTLASIKGQMSIYLKDGRITNLSQETEEKLGLGKLLSILSLQTIPRRLKLDFSDLSQKGYSFDIFKGHFLIANGNMRTKDSYIDGPVAYASMRGELDLKKRLYDLELKISPHIAASLPVVATIAGGPVAGIAAWIANKIIKHGMQKISAYTYKISGPWQKPVVQQVSIIKRKPG